MSSQYILNFKFPLLKNEQSQFSREEIVRFNGLWYNDDIRLELLKYKHYKKENSPIFNKVKNYIKTHEDTCLYNTLTKDDKHRLIVNMMELCIEYAIDVLRDYQISN